MGKITLSVLPSGKGVHEKYALVSTNDQKLRDFRLSFKFETFVPRGYRVGSYLFDPSNEVGGELVPGQSYENQVGIYNDSGRLVEIKKMVANSPSFTVYLDTVEPGKAFILRIKSTDKLAIGANKLFIKLLTDDPKQDTLEVTVIVNVAGAQTPDIAPAVTKPESKKPTPKTRKTKKKA